MKSTSTFHNNFFRRLKFDYSKSIFVKNDIVNVKFFEIKRFINRRQIKRRELKYLIRWRDYESKNDQWKIFFELNDVMKLVKNYENVMQKIVTLFDKLFIIDIDQIDQKKVKIFKNIDNNRFVDFRFKKIYRYYRIYFY